MDAQSGVHGANRLAGLGRIDRQGVPLLDLAGMSMA
jgi:hypothetical protein